MRTLSSIHTAAEDFLYKSFFEFTNAVERLAQIIFHTIFQPTGSSSYDESGMLIGEAPCMKDMIETTAHDFRVVNTVSIIAIFIIIALVERSISLPFILISVIEVAIFINLGLPHYMGQNVPFIAPICISTIQLGATVDYAILMTTRYKTERLRTEDHCERLAEKRPRGRNGPIYIKSSPRLQSLFTYRQSPWFTFCPMR